DVVGVVLVVDFVVLVVVEPPRLLSPHPTASTSNAAPPRSAIVVRCSHFIGKWYPVVRHRNPEPTERLQRGRSELIAARRIVADMLFPSRCVPALLCTIGGSIVACAPAWADPVDSGGSAQTVIDDLKADGYSVQINWVTGYDTVPLSYCTVTNINNPGDTRPGAGKLATVYVDVSCPNHQDD
ncbi:MAG TPA: hypothetical protein VE666_10240, partial [Mycobacterium sp.]|nr:hypothetical protein [Mycobacterium sp.]